MKTALTKFVQDNFPYWIALVLAEGITFIIAILIQPECEPCPGRFCDPCISMDQMELVIGGYLAAAIFIVWQLVSFIRCLWRRPGQRNARVTSPNFYD